MLKFAVQNLLSRPMRSLLALLGLTVAIGGMVGLFSVAYGLDHMVNETFSRIPGLVVLQSGAPIPLFSRIPAGCEGEIEAIEGVHVANAEVWSRVNLIDGKMIVSPPRFLFGTDIPSRLRLKPNQAVYRDAVEKGRFLRPEDEGTLHCVVSRQIAAEFEKSIDDVLIVNGDEMTIVGIYHTGSMLLDVAIIADLERIRTMAGIDNDVISSIYVEPTGTVPNDDLVAPIEKIFRERNINMGTWRPADSMGEALPRTGNFFADFFLLVSSYWPRTESTAATVETADDQQENSIEVRSASDWSERIDDFAADLDIFLGLMTSIGMSIAILSIVNTMLMSVSERMIEFGILKANGWSKTDVMKLVTFESALLGLAGGILGSASGWVGTLIVNYVFQDRAELYASPELLTFAILFSTLLGVLGGLYPAVWAMRMLPMDAIRHG